MPFSRFLEDSWCGRGEGGEEWGWALSVLCSKTTTICHLKLCSPLPPLTPTNKFTTRTLQQILHSDTLDYCVNTNAPRPL